MHMLIIAGVTIAYKLWVGDLRALPDLIKEATKNS